ncbi:MAG: ATP-binding cassette domain-containing protein [bacterium]
MIEIRNLTKKFGSQTVLNNINFTVKQGEILGFLGPNGAGKTTTMKIITGFWPANSGTVEIAGFNLNKHSLSLRKRIGYLPENVPLYDDMKVFEYLKFIAEMREIEHDKILPRIKQVVGRCGLHKVIGQPISELSKGYRQRVGLAQAIMHDPDILILDEPTTGLDPNQIVEIRELIKEIGKQKTVIFSTHILAEASATCDRVLIINNGEIVAEGTPAELAGKLGGQEALYIKIRGRKEEVLPALQNIGDVVKVEVKDQESDDVFGYHVEPQEGKDIREALAKKIMDNNWNMLELSKRQASLEDAFRKLTK